MLDISIIVPLYNEEESLPELTAWIDRVMQENELSYEVIMVDDGSKDKSWKIIEELRNEYSQVKGIRFRRNYGKSAALNTGFQACEGEVVITMDADLQDSPEEIPELRRMIIEDGFDLVSGWKKKRYDPITKTVPTKLFNWATRKVSGLELHDFNCGLKAYRNEVVKSVEVYGEMHRYIPVMAKWSGFTNVGEKVVAHQARKYGVTKFGWSRFINGFLDLMSILFVGKFGKKPMHFLGTFGVLFFVIGFGILIYLSACKLIYEEYGIADRPLFFFGILTIILGTQLFVGGFLAEIVVRSSENRNFYLIAERTGFSKKALEKMESATSATTN